jgi:hypothetical protein
MPVLMIAGNSRRCDHPASVGPLGRVVLQDERRSQSLNHSQARQGTSEWNERVVTSIINMFKATNWRVREAVAVVVASSGRKAGLDFFATVLPEPAWPTSLLDPGHRPNGVLAECLIFTKVAVRIGLSSMSCLNTSVCITWLRPLIWSGIILRAHTETAVACKSGSL